MNYIENVIKEIQLELESVRAELTILEESTFDSPLKEDRIADLTKKIQAAETFLAEQAEG